MTYEELEAQLLEDYRERFTEWVPGNNLPSGVTEPEWLVQADPAALQDWLRAALQHVRQHAVVEQNA